MTYRLPASCTGSGLSSIRLMIVKTAALAPMPSPSVRTTATVKSGALKSVRRPSRTSCHSESIPGWNGWDGVEVPSRRQFHRSVRVPARFRATIDISPFLRAESRACAADRAGVGSPDPRAEQDLLPAEPLAHLDLRLLHRAGSGHLQSVRAWLQPPEPRLAGHRPRRHRHRRTLRPAAGRRAEALHHPLHRGPAESALPPDLLHGGVGRGNRVR